MCSVRETARYQTGMGILAARKIIIMLQQENEVQGADDELVRTLWRWRLEPKELLPAFTRMGVTCIEVTCSGERGVACYRVTHVEVPPGNAKQGAGERSAVEGEAGQLYPSLPSAFSLYPTTTTLPLFPCPSPPTTAQSCLCSV